MTDELKPCWCCFSSGSMLFSYEAFVQAGLSYFYQNWFHNVKVLIGRHATNCECKTSSIDKSMTHCRVCTDREPGKLHGPNVLTGWQCTLYVSKPNLGGLQWNTEQGGSRSHRVASTSDSVTKLNRCHKTLNRCHKQREENWEWELGTNWDGEVKAATRETGSADDAGAGDILVPMPVLYNCVLSHLLIWGQITQVAIYFLNLICESGLVGNVSIYSVSPECQGHSFTMEFMATACL